MRRQSERLSGKARLINENGSISMFHLSSRNFVRLFHSAIATLDTQAKIAKLTSTSARVRRAKTTAGACNDPI